MAVEKLLEAALLGDGWHGGLDALASAARARGALILHNRDRKLIAAACSDDIREPVEAYLAGKAPPNSRQTRVSHDFTPGFRIDQDDYDSQDMARDAYYQDYLRPLGLGWHANARLKMEGADEIAISFKRDLGVGSFDERDKRVLDQILAPLQAATLAAEYMFDAEARGIVGILHRQNRPVLELDGWGRVRRQHGFLDVANGPLSVIGGRPLSFDPDTQAKLDEAIARAVRPPRRPAPVLLHDADGRRFVFQILPVLGRARDVFLASSAVGVLIGRPPRKSIAIDHEVAIELFGLTVREAHVVGLLCAGKTVTEIAAELDVVPETVRFHLKSVFEKTNTRRQAEVVALISQLHL